MNLTSTAFDPGQPIPKKHSGEADDVSPPLAWSGVPDGAVELALTCDDPDAPRPTPWVHWVLFGLKPDLTGLAEGDSGGGVEGTNDFGNPGYGGPMPPPGHGVHHYRFRLHALDAPIELKPGASLDELERAMEGHVLERAEHVGTYER